MLILEGLNVVSCFVWSLKKSEHFLDLLALESYVKDG